jgi:hypothetical protein
MIDSLERTRSEANHLTLLLNAKLG